MFECFSGVAVSCAADCTEHPAAQNAAWTCTLPVASGSSCSARCAAGYAQAISGAPRATCTNGIWTGRRGSCVAVAPPPPPVTIEQAQLSLALTYTGACSQQAAAALSSGLMADLQQTAAALPGATAAVLPGSCSPSRRRVTQVCSCCSKPVGTKQLPRVPHMMGWRASTRDAYPSC
jgi:hypothetical protein